MCHMIFSDTLILLRPDYLPSSHKVNESKDKLCTVINLLRQALAETSQQSALTTINLALDILGPVEVIETGETLPTNTALKTWEIEDFESIFRFKACASQRTCSMFSCKCFNSVSSLARVELLHLT